MLILGLNVGKEQYGVEATRVIEIVPLIELKKVPLAEQSIKGIFNYRGTPTPVIDLCHLFESRFCNNNLSTRIIIIEYKALSGISRPIGLIAEKVTDVMNCQVEEISNSGIQVQQKDFLGLVYKHNDDIIQLIDTYNLLPESISNQLSKHLN
ncbi:MAG: chemotaxis protein CheW [Gammaproteobacteria bacterium]|nr:chemotaxis protein CheW [Gammaproteobacteria bacterium]